LVTTIELEVIELITPEAPLVNVPSTSSKGREMRVDRFCPAVPPTAVTVTKPTGSVVAVVCAKTGAAKAAVINAVREIRRRFIHLKAIQA
jgi:hypothetical protein